MEDKNKSFASKAMGAAKSAPAPAKSEAKPEMKKAVMDKATAGLGGDKKSKHGMRSTHIDHHSNGSHTVKIQKHHSPDKMGSMEDNEHSFAVENSAALMAKLKELLGEEAEEKKAAPAPAPAAPAPAPAPAPSMP